MSDKEIEQEIQAKGKTAPRVTPADIQANIASEHYFTAEHGDFGAAAFRGSPEDRLVDVGWPVVGPIALKLLTFCVLVLRNGFTVTGESACASPENFDAEIGRRIARENAVAKVWPLMGYELRSKLAGGEK
jgi:hypothetical protein